MRASEISKTLSRDTNITPPPHQHHVYWIIKINSREHNPTTKKEHHQSHQN